MARDIGGSDPERMAPPRVQEYVENEFRNGNIDVKVVSDSDVSIPDHNFMGPMRRSFDRLSPS